MVPYGLYLVLYNQLHSIGFFLREISNGPCVIELKCTHFIIYCIDPLHLRDGLFEGGGFSLCYHWFKKHEKLEDVEAIVTGFIFMGGCVGVGWLV